MFEYELIHLETKEQRIIFGYDVRDAFRRCPNLNPEEWKVIHSEYID
jgi:hypothetical protein